MSDALDGGGAGQPDVLGGVMFDMDGLLVDTEPLWFEVETEIMARLGGTWSHADQAQLVGGSLVKSVGYMLAKAGPDARADAGDVAAWLVEGMVARIAERGVALLPGAGELLAEVAAARLPCALVTSSEGVVMDAVLSVLGTAGAAFDVTVCAADVSRAKPDPQPYLLAAELLGAEPARCVVLEDAPSGVAAAEAAGCMVVVVPNVVGRRGCGRPADPSAGGLPAGQDALSSGNRRVTVVCSLRQVSVAWLRAELASHPAAASPARPRPVS